MTARDWRLAVLAVVIGSACAQPHDYRPVTAEATVAPTSSPTPVRALEHRATRSRPTTPPRRPATTRPRGIALRVATCESGDGHGSIDWRARNRYSSASGAFQFLDSTWHAVTHRHDRAYQAPPRVQLAAFYQLWDGGRGARHWAPSRSCWG